MPIFFFLFLLLCRHVRVKRAAVPLQWTGRVIVTFFFLLERLPKVTLQKVKISATAGNIEPVCLLPIFQQTSAALVHWCLFRRTKPRPKIVNKVIKTFFFSFSSHFAVYVIVFPAFLRAFGTDQPAFDVILQTQSLCEFRLLLRENLHRLTHNWSDTVLENTTSKDLGRGREPLCENAKIDNIDL